MNDVKHEDCPFDTEGWNDLDIFFGNYGINIYEILAEITNEKEKENKK